MKVEVKITSPKHTITVAVIVKITFIMQCIFNNICHLIMFADIHTVANNVNVSYNGKKKNRK